MIDSNLTITIREFFAYNKRFNNFIKEQRLLLDEVYRMAVDITPIYYRFRAGVPGTRGGATKSSYFTYYFVVGEDTYVFRLCNPRLQIIKWLSHSPDRHKIEPVVASALHWIYAPFEVIPTIRQRLLGGGYRRIKIRNWRIRRQFKTEEMLEMFAKWVMHPGAFRKRGRKSPRILQRLRTYVINRLKWILARWGDR